MPETTPDPGILREAARRLNEARSVVLFTGAGVSAESGVPTFRERTGLWARFDPQELATPEGFARDPSRVWEWYQLRRAAIGACQPNLAHYAMARFLAAHRDALLVTQNVDGLHQRAMAQEQIDALSRVVTLHGDIQEDRCSECHRVSPHTAISSTEVGSPLPACTHCGGLLRPAVVWFGEVLPAGAMERALEAASRAEVCLVVGTSALVYPAAGVPLATLDTGGAVIEVNTEATALTSFATMHLRGAAAHLVPALLTGEDAP